MPFEAAYELYYRPLVLSVRQRATAWRLSEQDVDVEALVQDTFEQALRVWDSIRVPRAWLYTVARRRLARCVSAAVLRADGDPANHAEQGIVNWSTIAPSASTEDLVAARVVTELIQLMPQQRRQEVAYLRYIEEWSFNEIAEQLGCCPATARVHALNARFHIVGNANVVVAGADHAISAGGVQTRSMPAPIGLVVLFVLGCVLATGFLAGWPWALAVVGGMLAITLLVQAAGNWHARRRRARRRTRRRLH
ncbi:RNA polymerase sigma factor [Streptomyces sp. NPDC059101]|uniref:RNA polymerase sigma factor n=1 Tax=Streptomyces sp. NPDC059101 TaxID=3346728 RepID=UPI0036D00769